jgi:hypothetical protein
MGWPPGSVEGLTRAIKLKKKGLKKGVGVARSSFPFLEVYP